jgi:hypothetical protein
LLLNSELQMNWKSTMSCLGRLLRKAISWKPLKKPDASVKFRSVKTSVNAYSCKTSTSSCVGY